MSPSPVLPQHPGLDLYCELDESLKLLGCEHIVSFVLAGRELPFMVVDGVWVRSEGFSWQFVDSSYLENVRLLWRRDDDPRRRAAADLVIDLLEQALTESTSALRPLAVFQLCKLLHSCEPENLSPEQLRTAALALGVVEEEADLLVAGVVAEREGPDPEVVEEAIRARWSKQLRAAGRFADLLEPVATDHILRAFIDAVGVDNHNLDAVLAEAADLEEGGQAEQAAACYLHAATLVNDEPAIEAGLQRCPPPPPQDLKADLQGDRIELRWAPAPTSVGVLSYRVTQVSASERRLVSEVAHDSGLRTAEVKPPLGHEISYEVTTVRGGVESTPAASRMLQLVPGAEDLTVTSDRHGVEGRWRLPEAVTDVRVTRREEGPGQRLSEETVIESGRTYFRDPHVVSDRSYHYRVACGYRVSPNQVAWSPGRAQPVFVSRWPQPVAGLHVTPTAAGDGVVLRWDSPGMGRVAVLDMPCADPAPESDLAAADVGSLGTVCWQGDASAQGSDMRCEVPLPVRGVHYLAMVTMLDDRAVIGAGRTADVLEGVHRADYRRLGETVQLIWEWTSGVTQVLVNWSYPGEPPKPAQRQRITLDGYRRHRVEIPARDAGCTATITSLSTVPECVSVGLPAVVHVGPQYEVSYELRRGRRGKSPVKSVGLRTSGTASISPTFTLIARPGPIRPTRADQGEVVLKVDMAQLAAPQLTEHQVSEPVVRPPYYLLGFLTGQGSENFRLTHPDRSQLLVER